MEQHIRQERYSLYLIAPRFEFKHYAAQQETSELIGKKRMTVPLQLPLVAALTPSHYDVCIVDDEWEPPDALPRPDLVGITVLAATSGRAFEIADAYRAEGVPVVLGGTYASFATEECLTHADYVIIGEAEGAWQRFLSDFENGCARQTYQNSEFIPFRQSPTPRWDLVDSRDIMTVGVETSRGCVYKCNFCVVNKMFGTQMRFRDVDDVIAEIETLPVKRVFFVADNFAINKKYARRLVKRLRALRITWICQSSIDIARDEALLREMAEAGCISILIGFESLNERCLEAVEKTQNDVSDFETAIRRIHAHGIHVLGSFIVGFDNDTSETFEFIHSFVRRNNLVYAMLNVLSVAPGTELFDRMNADDRIHVVDVSYRNGIFPCIRYKNMTQTEILNGFFDTLEKLFSWDEIAERGIGLFEQGTFLRGGNDRPPFWEKATVSFKLLRLFLFSKDVRKRRLFGRLFRLVRTNCLSINDMVIFLLNMEGYVRYVEKAHEYLPSVRAAVAAVDEQIAVREITRAETETGEKKIIDVRSSAFR